MSNSGKFLCIKTFTIGLSVENKEGKIYDFYSLPDEPNGYWVVSEDEHSSTFFHFKNIDKYFINLAEWRDKQINQILEDD